MIDLYGLPGDFPGKTANQRNPDYPRAYAEALETAFGQDIGDARFIPHLQLYEYETLLFADVESFRYSFDECDKEKLSNFSRLWIPSPLSNTSTTALRQPPRNESLTFFPPTQV